MNLFTTRILLRENIMGSRYLITGVQLGIIKRLIQSNKIEEADKLIDEIVEDQLVFESNLMIERDVQHIQSLTIHYQKG